MGCILHLLIKFKVLARRRILSKGECGVIQENGGGGGAPEQKPNLTPTKFSYLLQA